MSAVESREDAGEELARTREEVEALAAELAAARAVIADRESWIASLESAMADQLAELLAARRVLGAVPGRERDIDRKLVAVGKAFAPPGGVRERVLWLGVNTLFYLHNAGPRRFLARLVRPWQWHPRR